MKVWCMLLSLAAATTGAPSTVDGDLGGTVVKAGYVETGGGGAAVSGGGGALSLLTTLGGGPWAGGYASKTIQTFPYRPTQVLSERVLEVEVPPPPPPAPAKKTVIERTVIPQYVEKRIQVPTYIERTIRVPTYVQRTVKVPVAPTIVEKEISHEEVPIPVHEHYSVSTVRPITGVGVHKVVSAGGGYVAAPVGFTYGVGGGGNGAALFNSIFNIPIQTLGAVNGLLNNLARGLTGGVRFSVGKGFAY